MQGKRVRGLPAFQVPGFFFFFLSGFILAFSVHFPTDLGHCGKSLPDMVLEGKPRSDNSLCSLFREV